MVMPSLKTGHGAARRRFWLAMSGFVMALALVPFSYKVERRLETAVHIKGGESEKVDLELAQRFQSPYAHRLVLVISGIPDPDSAKGADALGFLTSSLRSVPGVSGAVSSRGLARSSVHWEQWRGLDHRRVGPARRKRSRRWSPN